MALQIRVLKFAVPGVVPIEREGGRRAEVTKVDDGYRLVVGDKSDGDRCSALRVEWRNHRQLLWPCGEWIGNLDIKDSFILRRFWHALPSHWIDHAGKRRLTIDAQAWLGHLQLALKFFPGFGHKLKLFGREPAHSLLKGGPIVVPVPKPVIRNEVGKKFEVADVNFEHEPDAVVEHIDLGDIRSSFGTGEVEPVCVRRPRHESCTYQ